MNDPQPQEEAPLQNQTPESILSVFSLAIGTIQDCGWFLLIGAVVLYYLKKKYLDPKLEQVALQREQRNDYKKYDTDEAQRRLEAMERSRQKLQEGFNEQTQKFAEEQKQKEEAKRQAKIEDWNRHQEGKGYRSKYKPEESSNPSSSTSSNNKSDKKKLRPADYNPLMGGGGGGSSMGYRPTRRGASGGG